MFKNFSSWAIGLQIPLAETLDVAKIAGFQGFDINIMEAKDLIQSSSFDKVKGMIAKSGLERAAWSLPIDFRRDKETYMKGLGILREYADIAERLDFRRVFTYIKPFSDEL
jgi:sugar phosphate isomerase/epimerase